MPTPNEIEDRGLWNEKAELWDLHIGDEGDRNRRRHVNPTIWRMLGPVEGLRVLDAGCGTGYLSAKLAQDGAAVTAVDYSGNESDLSWEEVFDTPRPEGWGGS